jgi:hypothetical protein
MKIKQKKKMMFGDLITAASKNRDAGPDQLVINTRPVASRATTFFNSFAKGRLV